MAWSGPVYTLRLRDYLREHAQRRGPRLALARWDGDVASWRQCAREAVRGVLGLEWLTALPLNVTVLEEHNAISYSRAKIAFSVVEGLSAVAYVLVPAATEALIPAVVCIPDCVGSKEQLVGLCGDPRDDPDADFALRLCQRGMVSVALDPSGSGERADDLSALASAAGALGLPLMGVWVAEALRAVEYACGRMETRPERIGITGVGSGGHIALIAAALDERIACAATSGCMGSYRGALAARNCDEVPTWWPQGLAAELDIADLACLVAPRSLRLQYGRDDRAFDLASARACATAVVAGFEAMGERHHVETQILEGGPAYYGAGAFEFLETWLKLP